MKTIVVFLFSMIFSVTVFSQVEQKKMKHVDVDEVQVVPPKFIGINNAILIEKNRTESVEYYLARNIEYPQNDNGGFDKGTEVVQFVVLPTGELSDFKIINSVSPEIDNEVIRALEATSGHWLPGYNNNEPVAMEKEISIAFKTKGSIFEKDFNTMARTHFTKGTKVFFEKQKPKKALKHYDKGIQLLPNDEGLLLMRGMARYEVGDKDGAHRDWERITKVGSSYDHEYLTRLNEMKGYADLMSILND